MSANFKSKIVTGITWNVAARFGAQLVQFSVSVILARLLTPTDFGIISMIFVFTSFMGVMIDFGLGSAIVQRPQLTAAHINTAFWMNFAVGIALSVVAVLMAPFIATFYEVKLLEQLVQLWSINFVIITLSVVPTALLQRDMHFKPLATIEIQSTILSGTVGVGFVLLGLGVWSIVLQNIVFNLANLILKWKAVNWEIRFNFDHNARKDLWGYTVHLFGFTALNYWARNIDNLLVGKVFGAEALGHYNRAYGLMLLPMNQIMSVIASVMFSAMSSIQDDVDQVRTLYLRMMSVLTLISFPIMAGLLVTAEPFVLTVYGAKWSGMIQTLRILSIGSMFQILLYPAGWIYTSQGKTPTMFRWGVFASGSIVTGIIVGIKLGSIETVALLYLSVWALLLYPGITIAGRLIRMRFMDVMRATGGAIGASLAMAGIVLSAAQFLPMGLSPPLRLILMVMLGVISYTGLVMLFHIRGLTDILTLLDSSNFKRRSDSA